MTVRLADLLAERTLNLRLLAGDPEVTIGWAHSSDLADPTPFLEPGNLLLTTGTQFGEPTPTGQYAAYVDRLRQRGVAAIGFGTEVVRTGTPDLLLTACRDMELALLEVPYRTPFIAIGKYVADQLATAAHARDTWTLQAQRALSLAALSPARISGVLDELARQLSAGVLLLDSHGEPLSGHGRALAGPTDVEEVAADARRLLRRRLRTGAFVSVGDRLVFLQTLGRRNELRGALAVALSERPDPAATAVITSAVALAEFALDDATRQHEATLAFHAQLLTMVLAGHPDDARQILAASGRPLPARGLRVLLARLERGAIPDLQRALALGAGPEGALVTPWEGVVSAIATGPVIRDTAATLVAAEHARVAISAEVDWSGVAAAIRDARDALDRSPTAELVEVQRPELLNLLPAQQTAELARRRLAPLLTHPDEHQLIEALTVWLRHNAAWEPAARTLGLHRHTLKHQVQQAAALVDLDLDRFAGRAELWVLLESLRSGADLAEPAPVRPRQRRARS